MDERAGFSREYWSDGDAICTLTCVDGRLEVQLTAAGELVALWPCHDYVEAASVAYQWRAHPPERWLEDSCLE